MDLPISKMIWLAENLKPSPEEVAKGYAENRVTSAELSEKYDIPVDFITDCLDYCGVARRYFFGGGKRVACDDGHQVRSSLEKMVDNFLYKNGIPHEYEPKLPWGQSRADFKIGEYYVEIWGLVPNKPNPKNEVIAAYLTKMEGKRHLYKKHRLSLIELYPNDIPHTLVEKLGWLGSEVKTAGSQI